MQINTTMQTRSGKTYATNSSSSSREKNNITLKMKVDNVDNRLTLRMQTRSGKTYSFGKTYTATNSSSSSREKNNITLKMKVDNVDNRLTLRMQTRSGKTYTATTTSSSMEKNNIKLEMKVDNVKNVVNRTREPRPAVTDRIPCGFMRPQKISNELAEFLGKPVGTEMVRTDVSRLINSYIRVNNLQDPQNGRKINPDAKLRALLKIGENDELSYFNLQSYMGPHFIREDNVENVVNRTIQPRPTSRPISTDRRPSGFVRPTKISDELAEFLGKPVGTEMARTDVSRHINSYIRDHNLQDQQNGRKINPDAKLRALLKLGENDELTYFNLQKYMNHHFIRDDNVDNVENVVNRPSFTQSTPSSNDRRPLGFIAPTKISDELAMFLGQPVGTEMARTDVSRHINSYIRTNNLQDPENGRTINPDAKLRALLKIGENDELSYFNLQKYMKHHFIRDN
jgi:chromatin remodeling complex protein RSC6